MRACRITALLRFAATLILMSGLAAAQANWISFSPGKRGCQGMAFDASSNSTLMFGGYDGPGNPDLGDTWVLGEGGWSQLAPVNSPPPRSGPGMAYDATTKTVVLFGGNSSSTGDLNDTWIWDGTTWTQVFPPISPPARRWDTQGMAYHAPSGKIVLFGGVASTGVPFGDTWVWDGTSQTWTQMYPAASPAPRRAPLAYDHGTGTVVLFGGEGGYGGPLFGDTWVWNGTNWQQLAPANSPPPRSMASMAYDAGLRRLVLFGGSGAGSTPPFYNDSWTWDGNTWTQLSPNSASGPPARYAFGMTYDHSRQAIVAFGGLAFHDFVVFGDTWLLASEQ